MTTQKLFNKACEAVVKQGRRATSSDGSCLYEVENGDRCAVGHLIEDYGPYQREQIKNFIGDVEQLRKVFPNLPLFQNISGRTFDMLHKLQAAHDDASRYLFVEDFKKSARHIATTLGLQTPDCIK